MGAGSLNRILEVKNLVRALAWIGVALGYSGPCIAARTGTVPQNFARAISPRFYDVPARA
jgi:hypothetical protein